MRIVISGASGFIGQMLVPELTQRGAELVLLGRDVAKLSAMFPQQICASYSDFESAAKGADVFVNLAVLNNDRSADRAEMLRVNAEFAAELARCAKRSGISKFINVSSIHALDPGDTRPYAESKRAGVIAVGNVLRGAESHLYLPAIVGDRFAGTLAPLNALPKGLAQAALRPLSALKPVLPVSDLGEWLVTKAKTAPNHVILTRNQGENRFYTMPSRILDLSAAGFGILLLSPLLLATWLMIRLQGDGPAIFAQVRVGRGGKLFTCYKFRTMAVGTIQAATHEVSSAAVTPLGARLRKWKIDELPQLWNVLTGDMSLIGPRPCLPSQEELVRMRAEAGVLDIRPGLSGLAQVEGIDMSEPESLVEWDRRYTALRSLVLDIKLILKTAKGGGQGDRVGV